MGIAPYFEKAAAGAGAILRGLSPDEFTSLTKGLAVGVSFDGVAAASFEGRCALELLTNLLSRLYPTLVLMPGGKGTDATAAALADLARRINPNIELAETAQVAAVAAMGKRGAPVGANTPVIYVGSDGWTARLSESAPVSLGTSNNPFGAGAAACFAAANIFRCAFAAHLPKAGRDNDIALSLIDYDVPAKAGKAGCSVEQDLGECSFVGLGAVGNGAVWALSKIEALRGDITVIDPEAVDETNPQRYVLTDAASAGRIKVDLAREHLARTKLSVTPHQGTWAQYMDSRANWTLPLVAVAVDTPADRCAIQASLPQIALNAWTQAADLGVSRHVWTNDQACMACLYTPPGQVKSEDALIAEAIHFEGNIQDLRTLLYHDSALDQGWISRIEGWLQLPAGVLADFVGRSLRTLYRRGICGGLIFTRKGSAAPERIEVPMAFQSALAGIMLASELVLLRGLQNYGSRPLMTRVDLLRPLGRVLSEEERKHPGCFCSDPDYETAYRLKYAR